MASNKPKTLSAVEACRALSKSMRSNLDELNKSEFSPKEAGLRVTKSILSQIKAYEEELVKMRDLEKSKSLEKKLDWTSIGAVDDHHDAHESENGYAIHHAHGKGPGAQQTQKGFHLKHEDIGHISSHPTLKAAKAAAEVHAQGMGKSESLSKPPVSQAQREAMGAAASGHSTLGIPKSVGKEFIDADKGGKLPVKKDEMPSVANNPPETTQALGLKKNVFSVLKYNDKAALNYKKPEMFGVAEEEKMKPGKAAENTERRLGSGLPQDEKPKLEEDPKTMGGGQVDSSSEVTGKKIKKPDSPIFNKSLKKALVGGKDSFGHQVTQPVPKLKKPGLMTVGGMTNTDQTAISPTKTISNSSSLSGIKTKSFRPKPLGKGPKLGGIDPASKQMTGHSLDMAAKQAKNLKMPAQQQSLKMPSMDEHANRASTLSAFTPKGKFDKNELMKEMVNLEKDGLCKKCGKVHSMTKGCY